MLTRHKRINSYLLLLTLTGVLVSGCQTAKTKQLKGLSTLRMHLEVNPDGTDRNAPVPVYRANPVLVNVEKSAFLDESCIAGAKIVETLGGFGIQIEFDQRGKWLLEEYSVAHKGKRFAIFSEFGDTAAQARWLAAPRVSQGIANGIFVFTPDATREEAERVVRGLNNVAHNTQTKSEQ